MWSLWINLFPLNCFFTFRHCFRLVAFISMLWFLQNSPFALVCIGLNLTHCHPSPNALVSVMTPLLLFFQFFPSLPFSCANPACSFPKEMEKPMINHQRFTRLTHLVSSVFFSLVPVQHCSHITKSWHRPSGRRLSLGDVTDGLCNVCDGQLGL